jgi:hypothetical protein
MLGLLLNVLLRLSIVSFLAEVLLNPDDPRFAGKALPVRNLIIVGGLSLLFPALHLVWKRWESYPFWLDAVFLSIFWLDMAGNSYDLYRSLPHFDLLPHFHGTGAVAIVLRVATRLPALSAVGLANVLHLLLEAQEYYTDVFFGTHNVTGVADVVNDLLVGLLGTGFYDGAYERLGRRRGSA